MKQLVTILSIVFLIMLASFANASLPSITIDGLSGAAHWLWLEAEDCSYLSQGYLNYAYNSGLSGFKENQPFPYNFVSQSWETGAPTIGWQLRSPAIMNNPGLLVQAGSHFGRGVDVSLDGINVGSISALPVGQWGAVSGWAKTTLPYISSGNHTLQFTAPLYELYGWDGLLLYDGNIGVDGHPTTVSYSNGVAWMGANMSPYNLPIINADFVTPAFNVTDAAGVAYWIMKDGITSVYTPGTPIRSPGVYRVWAEANGSVWSENPAIAQQRVLAGADFALATNAANVKLEEDDHSVLLPGAVVSAIFADCFYAEMSDRSYGIRVNAVPTGLSKNIVVSVSGTMRTNSDGERYIDSAKFTTFGTRQITSLGMNCCNLGGGDFHYNDGVSTSGQRGIAGATGLNNIGLLVKVWGRLSPISSSRANLSDGSGSDVIVIAPSGQSFPTLASPYPYVSITGISSCERDSSTGDLKRVLRISDVGNIQWLTPYRNDDIAVFEPDMYLSSGDGSTAASSANIGGYIRLVMFNEGGPSNRIKDVLVNGVSLNASFYSKTPTDADYSIYSTRLGTASVPQKLLNAGDPIWYRILPIDASVTNTQVLIRLRNVPSQAVTVAAQRADGSLVQTTVTPSSAPSARFGLVTVDKSRAKVYAYVVLPSAGPLSVSSVMLDGIDVTGQSDLSGGFSISGVLPLRVTLQSSLQEGSYHILECKLSDGRNLITTFRANNGFTTAMYANNDSVNAYLASGNWKSIMLNNRYGDMAAVGKQWDVKIADIGNTMQYGPRIQSSAARGYFFGIRLLPASGADGGGLSIETSAAGSAISNFAQYADGADGDWIKPNELHDNDILTIKYESKAGNTSYYSAYLNGRKLMWWSGAASGARQSLFASSIELDQPGFVSYTNNPDFSIDSFSLLPYAKLAGLSTDFSTRFSLDNNLEESEAGTWTVQNEACYHTRKSTRNYGRTYIRTFRSDYNTGDWSYEVTFNRYSQSPQDYKYIGFGDGEPNSNYYGLPIGVYFAPDVSANGPMNVYRYNGVAGQNAVLLGSCGNFPGWGNERVRITRTGNVLKFEVDFNYSGGTFTPDGNAVTVDLSDSYYSFLDTSNSRLFFGCTEISNDWFDDMTVTSSIRVQPFVDDFTEDNIANKYTSDGDIDAPWRVDTALPGTLYFDTATSIKTVLEDFRSHYIDTWLNWSSDSLFQNVSNDYGVRLHPNVQYSGIQDAKTFSGKVYSSNANIYAYWLFDEPDCSDHYLGTSWKIGSGDWNSLRLGLYSQYLVKLADALGEGDPKHSTLLNTDLTYSPSNYFVYGQLGDIASSDNHYPVNAAPNWNPLTLTYNTAKAHRAGCMPNPSVRFLNASSDPNFTVSRAPFPGEEWIMAYAALAGGDNGLFYYWYNGNSQYGCQYQTELWPEIAKINREYQLFAPYIGVCFPISLSTTKPDKIWVRTVAAGPDTLMCVVVNQDFVSSESAFTFNSVSSASIGITLPTGFTIASAVTNGSTGPVAISFNQSGNNVTFDAGPLNYGRLILFSSRANVLSELQARWHDIE